MRWGSCFYIVMQPLTIYEVSSDGAQHAPNSVYDRVEMKRFKEVFVERHKGELTPDELRVRELYDEVRFFVSVNVHAQLNRQINMTHRMNILNY